MTSSICAGARAISGAVCIALSACANAPTPPSWLALAGDRAPPMVLRMGQDGMRNEALPSAGGQLAGYAASGTAFGLMYALPTLGASLLLVPLGLVQGVSEAGRASECGARWQAALGDVQKWLESTFGPVSTLPIVEAEVRRLVPKPPPVVEVASGATPEARAAELKEIGQRLGSTTLLVGDLWIKLEQPDQSRCGAKFVGYAQFRVQAVDQPQNPLPAYFVSATQEDKDAAIEDWAEDPEQAREQLRRALRELAARIVASYPWR